MTSFQGKALIELLILLLSIYLAYEIFHFKTCPDFSSWYDAQVAYKTDPSYKNLDRDHDGFACESLLKSK